MSITSVDSVDSVDSVTNSVTNSVKVYSYEMNHKNENNEYQVLVMFNDGKYCIHTIDEYRRMIKSGVYIDERIKPLYYK